MLSEMLSMTEGFSVLLTLCLTCSWIGASVLESHLPLGPPRRTTHSLHIPSQWWTWAFQRNELSLLNKQDLEDYEKHLLDMLCYFVRPDKGAHRTAGLFPSPFPNCRTYRKGISVPQGQCACLGCTRRKQKFLFRK